MRVMELDGKTAAGQTVEIEIDVIDAPAAVDWSKLLAGFGIDAGSAKAATVDGREGRRAVRTHGGREELGVAVVADGQLWIFKLDPAGEAERAAFDAFLASVDFDVK